MSDLVGNTEDVFRVFETLVEHLHNESSSFRLMKKKARSSCAAKKKGGCLAVPLPYN